ncbi:MAG: RpiB/LacA/LacB family sugar-phosphate isomerase, partial [Erysipelotrichaceae bacterium]|nr:RpiB/LacA/LacB family sugar-phosphate isomerase [Erysipelotrichaceae bacterium]
AVAEAVARGEYDRGILLCGTGIGVSIAANKVKGAYAALISDIYSAKRARLSNDANIACLGAFTTGYKLREELVEAFLTNEFVPGCSSQPKVDAFVEYDMNRK